MGETQVQYASRLLQDPSFPIAIVLMALEVPFEPMCKVARQAASNGCLVALKPSPLLRDQVPTVCRFVEGSVGMLFATIPEARLLLGSHVPDSIAGAEEAAARLLERFASLKIALVKGGSGYALQYRTGQGTDRQRLLMPTQKMEFPKKRDDDEQLRPTTIGAADAFFGGFAAAWCHGHSLENGGLGKALLWAYGAGQLCSLGLPSPPPPPDGCEGVGLT